jgi:hypothetical protein
MSSSSLATTNLEPASKPENLWVNLLCNALLPGYLLSYLSKEERLGPVWGLIVPLAIPLAYGTWDLWSRRRVNVFSVIAIIGTLLTGTLGLLKSDALWIALKEAAVPIVLGLAIPFTLRTRQPLVRTLLYNDQVLDTGRIHSALQQRNNVSAFETVLAWVSWVLAGAFLLSGVLGFGLARWLLTAPPGTAEFNAQLGTMNWLSWPLILVPSSIVMFYALFKLLQSAEALTGLSREELFQRKEEKSE